MALSRQNSTEAVPNIELDLRNLLGFVSGTLDKPDSLVAHDCAQIHALYLPPVLGFSSRTIETCTQESWPTDPAQSPG